MIVVVGRPDEVRARLGGVAGRGAGDRQRRHGDAGDRAALARPAAGARRWRCAIRPRPSRGRLQATADWAQDPPDAYVRGEAVMRTEARVPFRGWRMVTFTAYESVREQVNGILALEIMGFAILLALHLLPSVAPGLVAVGVVPAGIGGTAAAERAAAARDRRTREGAEGPGGGRADAGAIVETGGAGRDVGGGEP